MRFTQGQTIVEVVVAAGIMAVALTVLTSAVVSALANNREAKERAIATRLAQEGVEGFRFHRDNVGWGDYWTLTNNSAPYTVCLNLDTIFSNFPGLLGSKLSYGHIDSLTISCSTMALTQSNTVYYIGALVTPTDNSYPTPDSTDIEVRVVWISGAERVVSVSTQLNQRI